MAFCDCGAYPLFSEDAGGLAMTGLFPEPGKAEELTFMLLAGTVIFADYGFLILGELFYAF